MKRDLSRRSLLASGGLLLAGGALSSVAGATEDGAGQPSEPPPVRWSETYDGGAADTARDVVKTSDDNYVVAGHTGPGPRDLQPWAFSVDERGGRRWQRAIEVDSGGRFNTVVEMDDGGFLLGGFTGTANSTQQAMLARLDTAGEVQWRRTVESPRENGNITRLLATGDGQYVFVAVARGEGSLDSSAWVAAVDEEGERQWSQTVSERYTSLALTMAPSGDGGYVVGGTTRIEMTDQEQPPPFDGWLFALDGEGTQQWSRTYTEETDGTAHQINFVNSIVSTGSGYLAAGNTGKQLIGGQQGWLLSVDGSGERRGSLLTRPSEMNSGQFQAIEPFGDGYVALGAGRGGTREPGSVWVAGFDGDLNSQWSATQQYADGSSAVTATGMSDGGLAIFGNAFVQGEETTSDVLGLKLGGDPVPTPTPGATPTETDTPTPSPTPSQTDSPTPSPTSTMMDTATAAATEATDDSAETPDPAGTTSGDGPGFGAGSALAALAGGALLRRSDLGRSDDD